MSKNKKNIFAIYKTAILCFIGLVMSILGGCWTSADEPIWGDYLRPNEDPGEYLENDLTNYKYVTGVTIQGTELLRVEDPEDDGNGAWNLQKPNNYHESTLDLNEVVVSADSQYVYVYAALKNRYYASVESAINDSGFREVYVGVFFGVPNAAPTATNFCMNSPADSANRTLPLSMGPGFYCTNVQLVMSVGVIGSTYPNMGCAIDPLKWDVFDNTAIYSRITTTNNLIRTPVGFRNTSPVFAFKIERGSILPAGTYKLTMFTYGWEDYGQAVSCPGYNGYLRTVTGFAGTWNFGAGGSANLSRTRRCADLLIPTVSAQSNVLVSRIMLDSDFYSITLP